MRLLNLDPDRYAPSARAILEEAGFEVTDGPLERAELLARVGAFDAILLRFSHRIDAEVLARAGRLRVIGTNATGLDHIDEAAAAARGVEIVSLRGDYEFLRSVHATAELTWALALMLERHLAGAAAAVKAGAWDRDAFVGRELAGQSIGLLGVGRIGEKVARYAHAFGMTVYGYDLAPREVGAPVEWVESAEALFGAAEIISIHLPLSEATRGFVGAALLGAARPGARLINTARADLVDEAALVAALEAGRLGGAAVDVLPGENTAGCPSGSALWRLAQAHPRVLITPHIGGAAAEAWAKTERRIASGVASAYRRRLDRETAAARNSSVGEAT